MAGVFLIGLLVMAFLDRGEKSEECGAIIWHWGKRRRRPRRQVERQDYEYRREGTRNLFLACEPLAGWREVAVTERRTMQDFAHQMRWLVDEAYPEIPVVRWSWTI